MKPNSHKLSDFGQGNIEPQGSDSQMRNLPYLMKKRKDEPLNSKGIDNLQKEDEEKNKKPTKSIKSNQNLDQMKSPQMNSMKDGSCKGLLSQNNPATNSQPALSNILPYVTINNRNMMNEPLIFKNYSNPVFANAAPQNISGINNITPAPIAPMNTFLANTSNMIIQPNLSLAASPIAPINQLGNYVQIPVMIAKGPPNNNGNWNLIDNLGGFNDQMTTFTNLGPNDNGGFLQNSGSNMQKIFDNNIFIQQGNNNNNNPMNNATNPSQSSNNTQNNNGLVAAYVASFQEFENRIFEIIKTQNRTLKMIKEDNDQTHETLNKIKQELNLLKDSLKNAPEHHPEAVKDNIPTNFSQPNQISEDITGDLLINHVLNQSSTNFKYEIFIKGVFPKIIYKERYFNFDIMLVDSITKEKVRNTNKIPLDLAIYTSENPPKLVKNNTIGNKILNWNSEKFLLEGEMTFEKVQIREVSSHYRNGNLFLIIFARAALNNAYLKKEETSDKLFIDYQEIKPLVIENMVVRAKKLQLKLKKKLKKKNEENKSDISI